MNTSIERRISSHLAEIPVVVSVAAVAVSVALEPPEFRVEAAVANTILVLAPYAMTAGLLMHDVRSDTQRAVVMDMSGGASPGEVKERYVLNDRTLGILWLLALRVYCGEPMSEANCMPSILSSGRAVGRANHCHHHRIARVHDELRHGAHRPSGPRSAI